jgi:hypothetical protein
MLSETLRMQLHIALGLSMVYTTGLVAKSEEVLAQGLALAEGLHDLENQLVAIWALWFYHMTSGELWAAQPLADRFVEIGYQSADPADRLLGDQIVGSTMHFKGNQPEAFRCFERVVKVFDPPSDPRHATWILSDVRMPARAMLARILLLQGFIERASRDARSSFEDELARGRPLSLCAVLRYAVIPVAFAIGDLATAERSVVMVTDLAKKHGSAFWSRIGRCLEGALSIKRGDLAVGTPLLRSALQTVRNRPPDLIAVFAEGLAGLGELTEAVATIDERLERSEKSGERWYDPELLRIKGDVLLQRATDHSQASAEVCLQSAIDLARQQGALLWELRAALSLSRLWVRQHQQDDVRQLLAPIYDRFTEGFDTADLRSAGAMLDAVVGTS